MNSMLNAQMDRSESHFKVPEKRYNAHEKAMNAYTTASFNAAQAASLGYLDAAIKEIVDNAKAEKDIREREKEHYA